MPARSIEVSGGRQTCSSDGEELLPPAVDALPRHPVSLGRVAGGQEDPREPVTEESGRVGGVRLSLIRVDPAWWRKQLEGLR